MNISGLCFVTNDPKDLAECYSKLLNLPYDGDENFFYIHVAKQYLSFCHVAIEERISEGYVHPQRGGKCILELSVDAIEEVYNRVELSRMKVVKPLKTEAWGVTSFWVQDKDGNVTSLIKR